MNIYYAYQSKLDPNNPYSNDDLFVKIGVADPVDTARDVINTVRTFLCKTDRTAYTFRYSAIHFENRGWFVTIEDIEENETPKWSIIRRTLPKRMH
jgi:hypothetical protein